MESDHQLSDVLTPHGFHPIAIQAWQREGVRELLPIQAKALQKPHFFEQSAIVKGPTTCGKTFVGELACVKHMLANRKCLYLVPFKAIAEEKYVEFKQRYGEAPLEASILISTGDRRDQDRALGEADFHAAILTYEKLSAIIVSHPNLLNKIGALVIDEIQMVSDASRGGELELLITRARQIAPQLQIIGLSAVVSDLNQFDDWLNAQLIEDDCRPVPLREGVIARDGRFEYIEWDGRERKKGVEQFASLSGSDETELSISLAAQLLQNDDEQIILFSPTVAKTQEIAEALSDAVEDLSPSAEAINKLEALEISETVRALRETLKHAVAFHNGDLSLDERQAVEEGFRRKEIRCVVSTSTLSMGVNLPASSVVIPKASKWVKDPDWQEVPLTIAEYRNMCGRAGRYGLTRDTVGRSFLIAKSGIELPSLISTYVTLPPEPMRSQLFKRPMADLLLKTLANKLCDTEDGCFRFLKKTYASMEFIRTHEDEKQIRRHVVEAIRMLIDCGLVVSQKKEKIVASELGVICASSGLLVESFVKILEILKKTNPSPLDVAFMAAFAEDAGPGTCGLRFSTSEYQNSTASYVAALRDAAECEPSELTPELVDELPVDRLPPYGVVHAMKFICVAYAYVTGISSRDIEDTFATSAGKARHIGSYCSWVADTAAKIAWVIGRPDHAKLYERFSARYVYGCSDAALLLASASQALHRAERERLIAAGFDSLVKIVQTSSIEIAKAAKVDRKRVEELQADVTALLGESLGIEQRQIAALVGLGKPTRILEELYTLKGVSLEQVIEELLQEVATGLTVSRITSQREGEADLRINFPDGRVGVAGVTAKDSPTDKVGINKALSILSQSPELKPKIFLSIGRPEFLPDAIRKAKEHASNDQNFKLIPIYVLAEIYVKYHDGTLLPEKIDELLETQTGYFNLQVLDLYSE